jgi:chlorophyllide a reductase subunit Y
MAGQHRSQDMSAFFDGVGAGDTAGVWEDTPVARPEFRKQQLAQLQKHSL